jgi:hypothetical protein
VREPPSAVPTWSRSYSHYPLSNVADGGNILSMQTVNTCFFTTFSSKSAWRRLGEPRGRTSRDGFRPAVAELTRALDTR